MTPEPRLALAACAFDNALVGAESLKLPFAFDPRSRAAKRRRVFVPLAVLVLVGLAAGLALVLRPSGGPTGGPLSGPLATARFSQYGFSVRYPRAWTRVDWSCEVFVGPTAIAVLTNAQPAPKCPGPLFQGGGSFPPRQQLGPNVVSISLTNGTALPVKPHWNGHIKGWPAVIAPPVLHTGWWFSCPGGVPAEYRTLLIGGGGLLGITAGICGPDLAAGNRAVNRIVASLRFIK
jgi:hypothetical protein